MKKIITLSLLVGTILNSWSQEYKEMISNGTHTVQEIQAKADAHFAIVGTGRGVGYKSYKRWENQALMMMDENGMLKPSGFYHDEYERHQQELNSNLSRAAFQGSWEQMGPTYKNGTSGWNPGVGRITSLAVEETNQNHIVVGSPGGGVWKSTDGGITWTVLTDNRGNIDVYALTIDPSSNTTYYWGSTNGKIYKSTDGGLTWPEEIDVTGGTVNKILVHPTNSNIIYCTSTGGIFKTIDAGLTWDLIDNTATNGYDIEFKPGDPNTIYASGDKYYMSTDGGSTWNFFNPLAKWNQEMISGNASWVISNSNQNNTVTPKTGIGMGHFYKGNFNDETTQLQSIAINLSGAINPQLNFSYANADYYGDVDEIKVLYRNTIGSAWIELANYTVGSESWTDISLNLPNPSSDYYIAFEGLSNWGRGANLDDITVTTTNLGTVFQEGFEDEANYPFENGVKMLAVSPADDTVVFMLEEKSSAFGKLYKSTDSGSTFTEIDHTGKNYFGYSSAADDASGQAPRDMDIVIHPNRINEVHIAGVNTWRSVDGGVSFQISSQWTPGNAAGNNIGYCHADVDLLQFAGTNMYAGTDGGVFIAEDTANLTSNYYRDLTNGIGIRQFYRIGVSQTDPEVVTGGSQDNGSTVFIGGVWKDWLGADGMEGFVDKDNSNTIYGTTQNGGLNKSTNGGLSRFGIGTPEGKSGNWITPFEQDPTVTNTIYSGFDQVYKSTNGGGSWLPAISQNFGGNINHLKIAPSNNQVMYAARGADLYKTTDGGATNWVTKTGFVGNINSIAIHPTDPNKIALATTGAGKVYVSTDGGDNWVPYLYNLPSFSALAVVWHDNGNDGLYVGMNYGVFYIDSTFPGDWQPFSNNLANVRISELEVNTANSKLYAGTYGRGLWKSNLYSEALSIVDEVFENISVFPNPVTNELNISWDKNEEVTVKVFDVNGKLLNYTKNIKLIEPITINTANYAAGIYFVKINTVSSSVTKKISKN